MEKFIEVNETILVEEERLPFFEINNFTPLFDMGNHINQKIETINTMIDEVMQNQVNKIDTLQTKAEKKQWYTEFLRDLTQTNQALIGVMVMLDEKIASQK